MVHTLSRQIKRSEDQIRQLMYRSLFASGIVFASALVFLALYFLLVFLKE